MAPFQWRSQGPVLIFHPWNLNQIYPVAPEGKLHQHFPKDIALLRIKFEFTAQTAGVGTISCYEENECRMNALSHCSSDKLFGQY